MSKPLLTGARRASASMFVAAALAALPAGSAMAAGTGYGTRSPTNSLPPSGFTSVVIVKTLGNRGGVVGAGGFDGAVIVSVPRGAAGKSLLVAITHGSTSTVRADLHGALRDDKVLTTFGIELRHGSSPAAARKPVSVTFEALDLRPGDVVVAYNPKTRKFVPLAGSFSFRKAKVVVKIKSSESVAVLGPKK